jgi:hypothetical protein
MARKKPTKTLVAFKVEPELAEVLNRLPNKSAFIRKAIVAHLGLTCPLCNGSGSVSRGIHNHFAALIHAHRIQACVGCGDKLRLPTDGEDLAPEDRARLEQFLFGGPLYCDPCYQKAPPCDECDWHIDKGQIDKHMKASHSPEENEDDMM